MRAGVTPKFIYNLERGKTTRVLAALGLKPQIVPWEPLGAPR